MYNMYNMNNKLKIPSVLQWAWQRCAAVMLCVVLVFLGCKEDKNEQKTDEESFVKNFESAPAALVNLEQLPEWLQGEIKTHIDEASSSAHFVAYKGEWDQQTIYNVNNVFQSCKVDLRYDNGQGIDPNLLESVFAKSKNWSLIYEYSGESYLVLMKSLNFSDRREIKDKYKFPDISGMNDWTRPNIIQERLQALQVPDAVLAEISTEGLLETCIEFPYLIDIFHYDNFQNGFEMLQAEFNGFREILKRPDLTTVLIEKYKWMCVDVNEAKSFRSADKGRFSFRHFVLEFMLAQDIVLNNISKDQEETLVLLSLQHKEIKNGNPDIFSGLNDFPSYLLYAKKMLNDNLTDGNMTNKLLDFVQSPRYIDQSTMNYLNNYVQSINKRL